MQALGGARWQNCSTIAGRAINPPRAVSAETDDPGTPGQRTPPGTATPFPMRQVLLFMLAVFSFKIFLFLDLGGATYGAKMVVLSEGTMLERVAARAMVMDPVSEWIIDGVRFGTW